MFRFEEEIYLQSCILLRKKTNSKIHLNMKLKCPIYLGKLFVIGVSITASLHFTGAIFHGHNS